MKPFLAISVTLLAAAANLLVAQAQRGPAPSPASQRPPQTVTPQSYPADQVRAGQTRFATQCALCHARDTFGSDAGPDLSRSRLVAEDVRGSRIGPMVRAGRVEKGMPAFDLSDTDVTAVAAYIHDQKAKMLAEGGGRRNVEAAQLQSGNVEAGQRYFNSNCAKCHAAAGDLKGVATRYTGLPLLQRMLYPSGRGVASPRVTVQADSQQSITGALVSVDEFALVMTDSTGARRTFDPKTTKFSVDDKLSAHFDQLGKYTDADMHNVLAYLQTLK